MANQGMDLTAFVGKRLRRAGWGTSGFEPIQEAHRLAFDRIDEARAVDEVREPRAIRIVETRQHLGRHGQVRIENRDQLVTRLRETRAHGVRLAAAVKIKVKLEWKPANFSCFPCDVHPERLINPIVFLNTRW